MNEEKYKIFSQKIKIQSETKNATDALLWCRNLFGIPWSINNTSGTWSYYYETTRYLTVICFENEMDAMLCMLTYGFTND